MRQVLLISSQKLRESGIDAPDSFLNQAVLEVESDLLQVILGPPLLDHLLHLVESNHILLPQHNQIREVLDTLIVPLLTLRVSALVVEHQSRFITKSGVFSLLNPNTTLLTPDQLEDLILSFNTRVYELSVALRRESLHLSSTLGFTKPTGEIPDLTSYIIL